MAAARPRAKASLEVAELDDGTVVYDPGNNGLHHLNPSAALVFSLCDGTATIAEMSEAISDVYGVPGEEVELQVRALIADLRRDGVLERSRPRKDLPVVVGEAPDLREAARIQVPKSI
jgi:hypothetical protein